MTNALKKVLILSCITTSFWSAQGTELSAQGTELLERVIKAVSSLRKPTITPLATKEDRLKFLESFPPPYLGAEHIKGTDLDQSIPLIQTRLTNPKTVLSQTIDLTFEGKKIHCEISKFSLSHHHTILDYPLEAGGLFIASSLIPSVILTTILTIGGLGMMVHVGYKAYETGALQEFFKDASLPARSTSQENKITLLRHSLGLGNSLSSIMGEHILSPLYSEDFEHLVYRGFLSDGLIPGKSMKYEIILKIKGYS